MLSVAADAGMGHAPDLTLSSAAVGARLARAMGLSADDVRATFDLALLRFVGCTADGEIATAAFGDEIAARAFLAAADFGSPADVIGRAAKNLYRGRPWSERLPRLLKAVASMGTLFDAATAHCELAQELARALGHDERVVSALAMVFERWDGRGIPKKLREEAMPVEARLASLAHDVSVYHRMGGDEAALAIARERSGGAHEPRLVAALEDHAAEVLAPLHAASPWTAAMDEEPLPHRVLAGDAFDRAVASIGDFADLKGAMRAGHSREVARLAVEAGRIAGLDPPVLDELRVAAHVHDLGVVATSAGVWNSQRKLTDAQREAIRLHPYVGERCLARSPALAKAGRLASLHHERLDGSGYPKGSSAESLAASARILAAADVVAAMSAPRPHRVARSLEVIAEQVERDCAEGLLCPAASRALLEAAGHARPRAKIPTTGGLSDREAEVLAHLARGQSVKEVATALGIATKTADNHVQRVYAKIGVTSRAAATAWALRHGFVQAY